jgi:tetratricopeptide (TPR) repeat protein
MVRNGMHAMDHSPRSLVWLCAALLACLAACASAPKAVDASSLLHDELFQAPAEAPDAAAVFAMSPAMQRYAEATLLHLPSVRDTRRALVSALYEPGATGLGLGYDAETTRNAAQAFEARAGNCLSLVIMTASFAKYLGMPVSYQTVVVDDTFSRSQEMLFVNGHVNLVLGRMKHRARLGDADPDFLTIDFLPAEQLRGQQTLGIDESTIVAMYMNNRAAEALAAGQINTSYAWARQAVLQDGQFLAGINTLGVVYLRAGHWGHAERALRHVLSRQADHTSALANLAHVLAHQGRDAEAHALRTRLDRAQPQVPFVFLDRARLAIDARDYRQARDLLKQELRLQPYQSEVHFWLAVAHWRLGEPERAASHLSLAVENSTTRQSQALYAAKLALLRAQRLQ